MLVVHFPSVETFFQLSWLPSFSVSYLELELEVAGLCEGADGVVAFVRARGFDREETFLMSRTRNARLVIVALVSVLPGLWPLFSFGQVTSLAMATYGGHNRWHPR